MTQGIAQDIARVMVEARATGLFVSQITFSQPSGNLNASGAPDGTFVAVPGLVDLFTGQPAIGCMDAPLAAGTISALENRALQEIESKGIRHVALNGHYGAVIAGWMNGWRANVDGVNYTVFGAEPDSQDTQTRVKLQLVDV